MITEYPYINKFSGDIKVLPKNEGSKLSEDWERAKLAKNEKGERVFRFHISTPVIGPDGKQHMGIATVDISEVDAAEVKNGNGNAE